MRWLNKRMREQAKEDENETTKFPISLNLDHCRSLAANRRQTPNSEMNGP